MKRKQFVVTGPATKAASRLWPGRPDRQKSLLDALVAGSSGRKAVVLRTESTPDWVLAEMPSFFPDCAALVSADVRPASTPEHEAGDVYVLDCSSVFEASALSGVEPPDSILDMCAAPGGKSVLLATMFPHARLTSNEVIGKRLRRLRENLERTGIEAETLSSDPSWFAEHRAGEFGLVVVDAPCSGQSLPSRGVDNLGCFHPSTVSHCAQRQKRILANAAQCVAEGGLLAYMTCTYAREENEGVVEWLMKRFPQFEPVAVASHQPWQSHLAEWPCYRVWPDEGLGAGGFVCVLSRSSD